MPPAVTVSMPAWNRERHVREAIASVLAQTLPPGVRAQRARAYRNVYVGTGLLWLGAAP